MGERVDDRCMDVLLRNARTQNGFLPKPVTDDDLRAIYDILKLGPTSVNSCPARFLFVRAEKRVHVSHIAAAPRRRIEQVAVA